jgi:hypothetical protein
MFDDGFEQGLRAGTLSRYILFLDFKTLKGL